MKRDTSYILLSILLSLMSFSWITLSSMFSLFSYIESIYFAFDKVPGHFYSLPIIVTFFLFLMLSLTFGYIAFYLKTRKYFSQILFMILIVSILVSSIAACFMYPVGALDVFNYVLMGKLLVFYKQNPFLIPFEAVGSVDPLQRYAIFLDVTTGYGPWWLFLTSFTLLLSGTSSILSMVVSYKIMTISFFLLTGFLLYLLPDKVEEKVGAAAIYLLNPFVIFEGVVNAHNDILVSFFIIFAFWLYQKKNIAVFLSLILAGMIKLYALALVPVFLILIFKNKWRIKDISLSVAMAVIGCLVLYTPFWDKGALISGVLSGLQNAQVINGFSPYSLVREFLSNNDASILIHSLSQYVFMSIFLGICISLLAWVVRTNNYLHVAICILLSFFLCITIYQPWYVIPVLALLALSNQKRDILFTVIISASSLLSYPASVWVWFHSGWSIMIIHLFLAGFIALPSLIYLAIQMNRVILYRNRVQDLQ